MCLCSDDASGFFDYDRYFKEDIKENKEIKQTDKDNKCHDQTNKNTTN
jgi:hypothetical protein